MLSSYTFEKKIHLKRKLKKFEKKGEIFTWKVHLVGVYIKSRLFIFGCDDIKFAWCNLGLHTIIMRIIVVIGLNTYLVKK